MAIPLCRRFLRLSQLILQIFQYAQVVTGEYPAPMTVPAASVWVRSDRVAGHSGGSPILRIDR